MAPIWAMLAFKLITLAGSTAITVGFVGLFAFDSLDAYKWWLMAGGAVLVAIGEGLGWFLAKRMAETLEDTPATKL